MYNHLLQPFFFITLPQKQNPHHDMLMFVFLSTLTQPPNPPQRSLSDVVFSYSLHFQSLLGFAFPWSKIRYIFISLYAFKFDSSILCWIFLLFLFISSLNLGNIFNNFYYSLRLSSSFTPCSQWCSRVLFWNDLGIKERKSIDPYLS